MRLIRRFIPAAWLGLAGITFPLLASAAPLPLAGAGVPVKSEAATLQLIHCRVYLHSHRRCTAWRAGVCRRWVTYRHRCG